MTTCESVNKGERSKIPKNLSTWLMDSLNKIFDFCVNSFTVIMGLRLRSARLGLEALVPEKWVKNGIIVNSNFILLLYSSIQHEYIDMYVISKYVFVRIMWDTGRKFFQK